MILLKMKAGDAKRENEARNPETKQEHHKQIDQSEYSLIPLLQALLLRPPLRRPPQRRPPPAPKPDLCRRRRRPAPAASPGPPATSSCSPSRTTPTPRTAPTGLVRSSTAQQVPRSPCPRPGRFVHHAQPPCRSPPRRRAPRLRQSALPESLPSPMPEGTRYAAGAPRGGPLRPHAGSSHERRRANRVVVVLLLCTSYS